MIGVTPRTENRFAVTLAAATRSGSPSPVRLTCPSPHAADFPQRSGAAPVVHDLAVANPGLVERRPLAPDHHGAIWLGPRQRAEQHGVDDAEDRGVRADSQREREDGDGGEAGMAREHRAPNRRSWMKVSNDMVRLDGRPPGSLRWERGIRAPDRRSNRP